MINPSTAQWRHILGLIEEWDQLPQTQVQERLFLLQSDLKADRVVLEYLLLNYRLPDDPFQFSAGDRIDDKYIVQRKIGQGGMGVVYLAEHSRTGKEVAIKLLHPALTSPESSLRFEREIQILGRLDYRGIVRIFDAAVHKNSARPQGCLFYTMEYVRGESLTDFARKADLGLRERLEVMLEVCESLRYAHDRRIVHRDLKPSNIVVQSDGFPVLLDFGLAEFVEKSLRPRAEFADGSLPSGTLLYMSPEQAAPNLYPDFQGESFDVYSSAVVLYELLTNKLPFELPNDPSAQAIRRAVLEQEPRTLRELNPDCSPRLETVMAKALRKDPAERYQSVSGLTRALRACLEETLASRPRVVAKGWIPRQGANLPHSQWVMERSIGAGGVGEVWVGYHRRTKEKRAFKFCIQQEKLRLLRRETTIFRLLSQKLQDHPNIARLYEVSFEDEPYFMMFEFAPQGDLKAWLRGQATPIPQEQMIHIIVQVANALQAANDAGIIHRDVKPSNILIFERNPGEITAKLSDFGIGQVVSDELLAHITQLGFTQTVFHRDSAAGAGTRLYMAPELISGKAATIRSDIYALGIVLYQMLVQDMDLALATDWHLKVEDPFLREDLAQCFSGDPLQRFASAGELAGRLRSLPERRRSALEQKAAIERARHYNERRIRTRRFISIAAALALIASLSLYYSHLRRAAATGRGETLLSEAMEIRLSQRSGQSAESREKILAAAVEFTKSGALSSKLNELRSAAASSASLADLTHIRSTKFEMPVVAFCPFQGLIAATNRNCVIIVKSVGAEAVLATLPFGEGTVVSADFSNDGRFLLAILESKGGQRKVCVWNVVDGTALKAVHGNFRCGFFSPDGSRLALSIGDRRVCIHSLSEDLPQVAELKFAMPFEVNALAWSRDNSRLAVSSERALNVFVWALSDSNAPPAQLFHSAGPVTALAWDDLGDTLASGTASGDVILWEAPFHKESRKIKLHEERITSLELDLRHGKILSAGANQTLRQCSIDQSESVTVFPALSAERFWAGRAQRGARDRPLYLWNTWEMQEWRSTASAVRYPIYPSSAENSVWGRPALASISPRIAVALKNQSLTFYDLEANTIVARLLTPGINYLANDFKESGKNLILAGRQGLFRLPVEFREGPTTMATIGPAIPLVAPEEIGALATQGRTFAGLFAHGEHLHDLKLPLTKKTKLSILPDKILLSPSGRWCALTDRKTSRLQLFSAPLGARVLPELTADARDFAFGAQDQLIACGGQTVRLYDPHDLKSMPRQVDLGAQVNGETMAVSDNYPLCAIAAGGSVHIIRYDNGEKILHLESMNPDRFRALSFSPDGKFLLGIKSNGLLETWKLVEIVRCLNEFGLFSPDLDKAFNSNSTEDTSRPAQVTTFAFEPDSLTNQLASAMEIAEDKLAPDSKDRNLILEAARAHYRLQDYQAAIHRFREAGNLIDVADLLQLAISLQRMGDSDEALSIYTRCLEMGDLSKNSLTNDGNLSKDMFNGAGGKKTKD